MDWNEMITVGRVVRPHGNRGAVVVAPETDFAEDRFRAGSELQTRRHDRHESLVVAESREHQGRWIVAFESVQSIDDAERLRGAELRIAAAELRPLAAGGYYVHDLVGCRVETTGGAHVGIVTGVQLDTGTPLLEVNGSKGEILIPLAEEICRRIDVGAKAIVIEPNEGLLELNEG